MQTLTSINDLNLALQTPGLLLIFKHSTRCPVSGAAFHRFSKYVEESGGALPPACVINVVEARAVSNEAANRLGVTHQSPQLILARDGVAIWNTSHGGITAEAIQSALSLP